MGRWRHAATIATAFTIAVPSLCLAEESKTELPAVETEPPPLSTLPDTPLASANGGAVPPFHWDGSSTAVSDRPYWRRNLFRRVVSDQKFLVMQWWPMEFRRWSFTAPLLVGTLGAATSGGGDEGGFDLKLERRIDAGTFGTSQRVFHDFSTLGNASTAALGLGGAYLFYRLTGNERLGEATSLSAEALLDAGLWDAALKEVTARTRPNGGARGGFFNFGRTPPGQKVGSFPSGHAMGSFAVATVLAHVYSDKRWVPWVVYGTAAMIGSSRVALGRHFPSDVVVGSLLGNSIGRMVFARGREEGPLALNRFQPIYDPAHQGYGVGYSYSW